MKGESRSGFFYAHMHTNKQINKCTHATTPPTHTNTHTENADTLTDTTFYIINVCINA